MLCTDRYGVKAFSFFSLSLGRLAAEMAPVFTPLGLGSPSTLAFLEVPMSTPWIIGSALVVLWVLIKSKKHRQT